MSAFADLLVLVVRLDLEAEFAAIHLEQFGAYRHLLAFRRGAEMLDVDLEAHGGVPVGERVNPMIAALAAEYGAELTAPFRPRCEATLMMQPCPRATIAG